MTVNELIVHLRKRAAQRYLYAQDTPNFSARCEFEDAADEDDEIANYLADLQAENKRLLGILGNCMSMTVPVWKNMDTAPRDGTEVFVYVKGDSLYPTVASYKTKAYFLEEYGDENYMEEGWYWSFGYPSDFHESTIEPSHWMPLPKPPQALQTEGEA